MAYDGGTKRLASPESPPVGLSSSTVVSPSTSPASIPGSTNATGDTGKQAEVHSSGKTVSAPDDADGNADSPDVGTA